MSYAIIEVTYKDGATGSKYLYPKSEKEFNLTINDLRSSDDTSSVTVFAKTEVYTKKITWDKATLVPVVVLAEAESEPMKELP